MSHVLIAQTVQIGQALLLSTHRKSHVDFRFAYLHLTLVHYKGQGQGHVKFNC